MNTSGPEGPVGRRCATGDAQPSLHVGDGLLQAILLTANDAIVVCDARHCVVLANEAARQMFRSSLEERSLQNLLEPDSWAQYMGDWNRRADKPSQQDAGPTRGQGRRADGSVFPLEYSLARFTDADGAAFATIVARDISGRLRQEALLLAKRHELLQAHSALQQAQMRESTSRQQAIARELHDAVGSSLAGVSLLLATACSFTREPEATVLISRSQQQVLRTMQQVREIARGMMPAGEEGGALLSALQQFATDMSAIPGLRCTVSSRGDLEEISAAVGGHLFRIVQEATNNALCHGQATHVRITLARVDARCA